MNIDAKISNALGITSENIKEFSVSLPTWFIEKNFRGLAENLK